MANIKALHLFEAYGIEMEYMIVRKDDLSVLPAAGVVLRDEKGEVTNEVDRGELSWSNELVAHVVELKTGGPAPALKGLAGLFQRDVRRITEILEGKGAMLLPTAMHPWMDPHRETVLWPHENSEIYSAFDRIFGCSGHGWSNLQSVHLNLPFQGDAEFGRLHAAIRLILPLLPAIAASSPLMDGRTTGTLDNRLAVYRTNSAKVPSVSGDIIPEPFYTEESYRRNILERIYQDLAPLDPEGILREEWVNARGAIARFERSAIEIRLLDIQENPLADFAVLHLAAGAVRLLVEERLSTWEAQKSMDTLCLDQVLRGTIREAESAIVEDQEYLSLLGLKGSLRAGEIWAHLYSEMPPPQEGGVREALGHVLKEGSLSTRILRALHGKESRDKTPEKRNPGNGNPGANVLNSGKEGMDFAPVDRDRLERVYRRLGECLVRGELL